MTTDLKNIIDSDNKHKNGSDEKTALTTIKNRNTALKDTNQSLTKKAPRRRRVLYFEELTDTELVKETKQYIQKIEEEVAGQELVSLHEWCRDRHINPVVMVDLLNEANLPIIRIGGFEGAYELHLDRVKNKEIQRQLQQQIQNRVCARVLSERYAANKENKENKGNKKKEKAEAKV